MSLHRTTLPLLLAFALPLAGGPRGAQEVEDPVALEQAEAARRLRELGFEARHADLTLRETYFAGAHLRQRLSSLDLEDEGAAELCHEAQWLQGRFERRAATELTPHLAHVSVQGEPEDMRLGRYVGASIEDLRWKGVELSLQREAEIELAFEEAFAAGLYESEVRRRDEPQLFL